MTHEEREESIRVSAIDKSHARAIRRDREANWLTLRGYDGLYSNSGECACKVDDLYPCGVREDCEPGYLGPCPSATCGEHDWHMGSRVVTDANLAAVAAAQALESPQTVDAVDPSADSNTGTPSTRGSES